MRQALALVLILGWVSRLSADDPSSRLPEWAKPGRCGTNCLYVYLKILERTQMFPRTVPYGEVARAVPVDGARGSSLADLREAATGIGADVEVRQVAPDNFSSLTTPFIAHLDYLDKGGAGHFITVFSVERGGVIRFIDGSSGLEHVASLDALKPNLTGFVLLRPVKWLWWSLHSAGILRTAGILGFGVGLFLGTRLMKKATRREAAGRVVTV